jgi:putative SOS response-associated peptidase YedK
VGGKVKMLGYLVGLGPPSTGGISRDTSRADDDNYPPHWNGAPSQDQLVIRRNHKTGEVSLDPLRWGLIPRNAAICDSKADRRKLMIGPACNHANQFSGVLSHWYLLVVAAS